MPPSAVLKNTKPFIRAHYATKIGWLEPLLDRIARNATNVVTPVIDVIDDNTFQYHHGPGVAVGGFDWNLQVASVAFSSIYRFDRLLLSQKKLSKAIFVRAQQCCFFL